ncbi:hypothetical protein CFSAN002367_17593 [Clostridium botulinum CFSAN002367]|nr:hypothetical protein CFSAN002369_23000 [Clostridium botulinum CFSAN002369]EPS49256.1 hypothetical protein CFSAN002367_17593 [Clostridium botulinum CFSAN002367]
MPRIRNEFITISISSKGLVLIVELIIEELLRYYFLCFAQTIAQIFIKSMQKLLKTILQMEDY